MEQITHSEMVARLMKPKSELQFTPEQCDMIHAILGISGECGELLDSIKKHVIYGKQLDRENLVEELGDIEFYLQHLRAITGISLDEVIDSNMAKLAKRYPGYEYTDEKAKERADKAGTEIFIPCEVAEWINDCKEKGVEVTARKLA